MTMIATRDRTRRTLCTTRAMMPVDRTVAAKFTKMAAVASVLAMSLVALPGIASAACDLSQEDIVHGAALGILDGAAFTLDPGGVRTALRKQGVEVGGAYYGETYYNWGGIKDGGQYDGVLELYLNADMQKLGLWKGLCFHTDGYQIHGNSITGVNVGGLMPVSSLEAEPSTRLFELWFEQHMFNDTVAVKVGQLAADAEFFAADGGGYFIHGTWGWAPIAAENNPNGGPAYPLATPGVRVAVTPVSYTSVMAGLYNGDPAHPCAAGDPQICNNH